MVKLLWMGISLTYGDIFTLISMLRLGHPFKEDKKILWLNHIQAFYWNLWLERNACIFPDKNRDTNNVFGNLPCFLHLLGAKCLPVFVIIVFLPSLTNGGVFGNYCLIEFCLFVFSFIVNGFCFL